MLPIDQLVPYFQVYGPVAVTIGVAIAAWAVFQNIAINQRNKRADCIFHCNNRYDEIYKYKSSIVDKHTLRRASDAKARATTQTEEKTTSLGEEPDETRHYYARYWGLKSDEFDYWLAKLIDLDTIMSPP
jgi:predicted HTH transcriptional regulator